MQKLVNPYLNDPDHHCFVCSKNGIVKDFFENGEYIECSFDANSNHSGFMGIVHGGIIATLMDEVAAWVILVKCDTSGVTVSASLKFIKKAMTKNTYLVRGKIIKKNRKLISIATEFLKGNEIIAVGTYNFLLFTKEVAQKEWKYPGKQMFYPKKKLS